MSQSKVGKVGKVAFVSSYNGRPILRIAGSPSYLFYYHIHFDTSSDVGLFFCFCSVGFVLSEPLLGSCCFVLGPHSSATGLVSMLCLKGPTRCPVPKEPPNDPPTNQPTHCWPGLCSLAAVFPSSGLSQRFFFLGPQARHFV